jgi:anthranilate phosphoribosyltransferase
MDVERALVVHGSGLDEIAIHGGTRAAEVRGDGIEEFTITPETFGLPIHGVDAVAGGDPEENAADLRGVVTGETTGAKRDIILANAGAAIYVAGEADSLREGAKRAAEAIDSGAAAETLDVLRGVDA